MLKNEQTLHTSGRKYFQNTSIKRFSSTVHKELLQLKWANNKTFAWKINVTMLYKYTTPWMAKVKKTETVKC